MIFESRFNPQATLANRHLQTLLGPLLMPVQLHPTQWLSLELPDDDFLEVALFGERSRPMLVLLHGLEGSYQSHYAQRVIRQSLANHWQVAVVHFRSCGRELNRRMNSYHSGASGDLQSAVEALDNRFKSINKVALGFSFGGNVLLKWLGENPKQTSFLAAMAVSVPLKLDKCADAISQGFSQVYQKHLVDLLIEKTKKKLALELPGPQLSPAINFNSIRNFWQFDHQVTAPLHGYSSAEDYYRRASSYYFLPFIETPTLILHALDDPFMSPDVLPGKSGCGSCVIIEASEKGGHVGFIDHWRFREHSCFLAQKVTHHFKSYLSV